MNKSPQMPEPLKNRYSPELINSIADHALIHYPKFDKKDFIESVLTEQWESLELKERMRCIAVTLKQYFPSNYAESVNILLRVAAEFSGLAHMCFPDYIELYGLEDFDTSMMALENLTSGSTSEFAIRPFIIKHPEQTMKQMKSWSNSNNEHVRRLASEGCRPRLPWAMALPDFKRDPQPLLEILTSLINDQSLYVRRSVANNLNDISKDHPETVIAIAEEYLGQNKDVDWVIKHACRGLLKQGHKKVLSLFGYTDAHHTKIESFKADKRVKLGERLNFEVKLSTQSKTLGKLRLEFEIDFMKANGKLAGKIFKIGEGDYLQQKKSIDKYFSFKPISTRKYYLGEHRITLVINGEKLNSINFKLVE